jgi:hypothetical protein
LPLLTIVYFRRAPTEKAMDPRANPDAIHSVGEGLTALFAEYEKAFSSLDLERSASFYAESFIAADPNGSKVFKNDARFRAEGEQQGTFYKRIGMTSARIISLAETPISRQYSLVKVHWGATSEKTADTLIEFDVSYLVQQTGDKPKIILYVSHEDEQRALTELGLIPR